MYKETRTYTDFDGNIRNEDFYFNLTKAEVFDLEIGADGGMDGGMTAWLNKIVSAQDAPKLAETFKKIIHKAYGVKSSDGRQFMKIDPKDGHRLVDDFIQTQAYSDMYMEFVIDAEKSSAFINGIFPTFTEEELKHWEEMAEKARAKRQAEIAAMSTTAAN